MMKRALAALTIIALAGLLAPGCDTPASEVIEPNYTNPSCGLSMWYPEDWIYEEGVDQVAFATSAEAITDYPLETGAFMLVVCGDLEDQTIGAWGATVAGYVVSVLGLESLVGEARTIGGQESYLEPAEGSFEGGQVMTGFTAVVEYEGWGYLFAAVGAQDEWAEYEPVLLRMLDSVQFTASTTANPTGMSTLARGQRTPTPFTYQFGRAHRGQRDSLKRTHC
jgi:hypothetical protein